MSVTVVQTAPQGTTCLPQTSTGSSTLTPLGSIVGNLLSSLSAQ